VRLNESRSLRAEIRSIVEDNGYSACMFFTSTLPYRRSTHKHSSAVEGKTENIGDSQRPHPADLDRKVAVLISYHLGPASLVWVSANGGGRRVSDSYHLLVFNLLLKTGLREQEAMHLNWPDISFTTKTLTIHSKPALHSIVVFFG
jgi:integrase